MMKYVKPNDPFNIPASTYNQFIDLARSGGTNNQNRTIFKNNRVQNFANTQVDSLPMYAVMDLDNTILREQNETDLGHFEGNDTYFVGVSPVVPVIPPLTVSARTNAHRIGITQEPLLPNQVGKCVVKGITKVKIKKESGVDLTKPLFVTKINNDNTQMAVTNRPSPDALIWHDTNYKLAVVHLGFYTMNQTEFIGILDCVADTAANTYKLIVKDYYSGRVYHILNGTTTFYRNLTVIPPRPKSTAVIAQYAYTTGGLDYVEQRPFYDTQQTGIVKYTDDQVTLNNTVLGRRSAKDRIAPYTSLEFPENTKTFWRQP